MLPGPETPPTLVLSPDWWTDGARSIQDANSLSPRRPCTWCVMNEENRTQKVMAEAEDVTEVTIRNRYTELKRVLDLDI